MKLQKTILKNILLDITGNIIHNISNKTLYKDLCLVYEYLIDRKLNSVYIPHSLAVYYKVLFILVTLFKNVNLYVEINEDIDYDIKLNDSICSDILKKKKFSHIVFKKQIGKIFFKNDEKIYNLDWLKINQFTYMSYRNLKTCINDEIHLLDFNKIYFVYFLGYVFIKRCKLFLEKDIFRTNISDNDNSTNALFISHKYTLKRPNKCKKIIFYSFNIRQFLLYNAVIDSSKIIGKLFNIFNVHKVENSNILIYNGTMIKLPKSYQILDDNVLLISKKTSKIKKYKGLVKPEKIQFSNLNTFLFKYGFIKRYFLNIKFNLSKIQGYKIYTILINKFPELNSKNYTINAQNMFLHNNYQKVDNILFSMMLINNESGSKIILDISYSVYKLEKYILEELDKIIKDIVYLEDVKIKYLITVNNYKYVENKIHLISEIKSIPYLLRSLFSVYTNIMRTDFSNENQNLSKKQLTYEFDKSEIKIINELSIQLKISFNEIFKLLLIKSVFKFFPNKIILFLDETGVFLLPNVSFNNINYFENIINTLFNAKIMQSFTKSFIFKIFNNSKHIHNYSEQFIQVNETINNRKNINYTLDKINTNSDVSLCSTQVNYIIDSQKKIKVYLSFQKNNDKVKYVVSDILNI